MSLYNNRRQRMQVVNGVPYGLGVLLLSGLLIGGAAVYFGMQNQADPGTRSNPKSKTNSLQTGASYIDPSLASAESVAAKAGKLIQLPAKEVPVLITIKDQAKLQSVKFLKQAITGDQVLIYQQAQQGYIYRPSTDQIVAAGRVDLQ